MSTFIGWARAIEGAGFLDHTYVTIDGKKFGCWGGDSDGHEICRGEGTGGSGSCLAGDGHAGLVYALDGVCHQTANRILRPANVTVKNAQGYGASWAAYGAYGAMPLNPLGTLAVAIAWAAQESKCGIEPWHDVLYLTPEQDQYFVRLQSAYAKARTALADHTMTPAEADVELQRLELDAFAAARLPDGLTPQKLDSIANSRADMLGELHPQLLRLGGADAMPNAADATNKLVNDFLAAAAQSLTADEYKALFDFEKGVKVVVVDPNIVAQQAATPMVHA